MSEEKTIDFSTKLKELHDSIIEHTRNDDGTFQALEDDLNNLFYPSKIDKRTKS
jgi:hypothetical protein